MSPVYGRRLNPCSIPNISSKDVLKKEGFNLIVEDDDAGRRLDTLIVANLPELSRSLAAHLIRQGSIRVDGLIKKPGFRLSPGQLVSGELPEPSPFVLQAESLPLEILFEDASCLVINKRPGMVVHPSPGHDTGTLANGLIYHCPEITRVGGVPARPGIVHRLDKDTSGVILVAKTDAAHRRLTLQFRERTVHKSYLGFVYGIPSAETGRITLAIGRHSGNRKKMSAAAFTRARQAETLWRIRQRFDRMALLEFVIKTGRTHQIRVHCAAIRHPIIGDPLYGLKKPQKLFSNDPEKTALLKSVPRQMLHAWRLEFRHPVTEKRLEIEAPLPADMVCFQDAIGKAGSSQPQEASPSSDGNK
jgi:23S rRNA pseudouridine1911/1915/1917 synthase